MVINLISYIKDYGVSNIEYEYILRDLKKEYIDILDIESENIKEVLKYYNSINISSELFNIIMHRFDLIVTTPEELEKKISKIDSWLFKKIVNNNVDNLVMFGI